MIEHRALGVARPPPAPCTQEHASSRPSPLTARRPLIEDHVADQVFEVDRGLRQRDLAARLQHLDVAARDERQILAAQQAVAHDRGGGVGRQLDVLAQAEPHLGAVGLGIQTLTDHRPDLDPADPDVAALLQTVDLVEAGDQLVAAVAVDLAGVVGEQKETDRDDQDDRAEQRLEEISGHGRSTGDLPLRAHNIVTLSRRCKRLGTRS